ncbi:MAG TPA: hypothetical protein VMD91_07480 [Candidatus Sulfotelmatobacter sp.]|nr:hypothetical protein [Candidatus Sulfotelmatobacter sp.]
MRRTFLSVLAAAACVALACSGALADPLQAAFTLSINPLDGGHEVGNGQVDRVDFAPLPLADLEVRWRGESVHVEGLPSVTFGYGSNPDGAQSTRLSIINATFRQQLGAGFFAGFGQTIYNQRTDYGNQIGVRYYAGPGVTSFIDGDEIQDSRVTGPRLELGKHWTRGRDSVELVAAVNPTMHGVQYTQVGILGESCIYHVGCRFYEPTFADPEIAAQTDLSLRVGHRLSKHGDLLYGLRYLNYTAHYALPGDPLADRNVGFAPTIAYRLRF